MKKNQIISVIFSRLFQTTAGAARWHRKGWVPCHIEERGKPGNSIPDGLINTIMANTSFRDDSALDAGSDGESEGSAIAGLPNVEPGLRLAVSND